MKNLLKITVVALILVLFVDHGNAQLNMGVKLGINLSSMPGYSDYTHYKMDQTQTNWTVSDYSIADIFLPHIGAVVQYTFPLNFFVQPELLFSLQGCNEKTSDGSNKIWLGYLKLPIYAGYKIQTSDKMNILLGVGPYAAYGIEGSDRAFGDNGDFKRFDAGISALVGMEYKQIQLNAAFDRGFVDQMGVSDWQSIKKENSLPDVYNQTIKLSLAFFFR